MKYTEILTNSILHASKSLHKLIVQRKLAVITNRIHHYFYQTPETAIFLVEVRAFCYKRKSLKHHLTVFCAALTKTLQLQSPMSHAMSHASSSIILSNTLTSIIVLLNLSYFWVNISTHPIEIYSVPDTYRLQEKKSDGHRLQSLCCLHNNSYQTPVAAILLHNYLPHSVPIRFSANEKCCVYLPECNLTKSLCLNHFHSYLQPRSYCKNISSNIPDL